MLGLCNPWDIRSKLAIVALVLLVLGGVPGRVHTLSALHQAPPATREARWQEDLGVFAEGLASRQKDFSKVYPKKHFDSELAAMRENLPQLSDAEIILRLMRLMASAGIGHNTLRFPQGPLAFHRLPLQFYWYSDGLGVIAASKEYSDALGTRVIRIGSLTPEQLETAVAPYFSHETETWIHMQSPNFMNVSELLQSLKMAAPDGSVNFTFAKPDGSQFTRAIAPVSWADARNLLTAIDVLHIPASLARKYPNAYWYEVLPDSQTLYIQYNRCQNDPKESFVDFTTKMFESVDAQLIQRVIVDLRFNPGGDSRVVGPLENALKKRSALIASGHLYTLIGRLTFSSGLMAAVDFRNHLHAILIGEPSGEKPNGYGEVRELTLPNSKLVVAYSTKYFRLVKGSDPPAFVPDITVTNSLEDFTAGRDPVLDAALHHKFQ